MCIYIHYTYHFSIFNSRKDLLNQILMESSYYNLILFTIFLIILSSKSSPAAAAAALLNHRNPSKLFVFGDSYADTGNAPKSIASSWKEPYGATFPGFPAGRYSDGRVLTDYVARTLRLKSPAAYALRESNSKPRYYTHGMNFAVGGSGVFNTRGDLLPNMTTQIDFLEDLINQSVFTKWDLHKSLVLVALSGNDYALYVQSSNSTIQGLQAFIPRVVNQLALNLKRIRAMRARKIVVTTLQPLGCLPRTTQPSSYTRCNDTVNLAVNLHNLLLSQAVAQLNNQTKNVFILQLYNSFATHILNQTNNSSSNEFENPLKPCCVGTCETCSCGTVDDKGAKLYTVCANPNSYFFWDSSHPTQAGWRAVYVDTLKKSLQQFLHI